MTRKEVHLDINIVKILEQEAKRQNRSLKSYLEYLLIEKARRLEGPSEEYKQMMDVTLENLEKGVLNFSSIEEVIKRNDISN